RIAALGRAAGDLADPAARAVGAWQDQVTRLVEAENVTKRSIAKAVTLDDDALATVLVVSLLGSSEDDAGTAAIPRRLLTSLFGAGPVRDIMARIRGGLRHRVKLILDEDRGRVTGVVDWVGRPGDVRPRGSAVSTVARRSGAPGLENATVGEVTR